MTQVVSGRADSQIRAVEMSDARWHAADGRVKLTALGDGKVIAY